MKGKELLYYNGFGGFCQNGKEYIIDCEEKTTPLPWSHIIANNDFGTIVTANGGGYVWKGNSQTNKITSWSNDCLKDTPSEKLILNLGEKNINLLPYDSLQKYKVVYGFGYAKFFYEDDEIKTETLIYVPRESAKKVYEIKIESKKKQYQEVFVEYLLIPVLGVSREFTKKHLVFETSENKVIIRNCYRENFEFHQVGIHSFPVANDLCVNDAIVKMRIPLKSFNLNNFNTVQIEINCQEEWKFQDVKNDIKEIDTFWNQKMERIRIKTPVESMNLLMNGWLIYQTLCCRLWARTSFYQAGGAFGFRDQLQDVLSLLWIDPDITKKQILYHAMHQFKEGDVLHWWHPENNMGTRTRYTDDLLWLPYVLSKYILFTGDETILDEKIPYVKSELLQEQEEEKYVAVEITNEEETTYDHAKKAIQYGVKLAENGLPYMRGGDWNDGMNHIKGQSIWLGFFIYTVLDSFRKICEIKKDIILKKEYEETMAILVRSLNQFGWDGKWYRRAYFPSGEPIGSAQNDECKIDGISQSWAVISGAGDLEKSKQAMDNLDVYLVDRENMMIKLLTPPFDKTKLNPGYIKEYIPGVRENGGQYTHGAIWSIIANAILKNGDSAGEYFRILNPIEHARTKENALRYKVEPYVVAADIYANSNMMGRGGWTWYTGSSSWLFIAGIEYILGITKQDKKLRIHPCIPHEWEFYEVEYFYQETKYEIKVKNPQHKTKGITSVFLDNTWIPIAEIELKNDKKSHTIEIIM